MPGRPTAATRPTAPRNWTEWVAAGLIVAAAAWLHLAAAYALPRPWPDEAHFITPALNLVHDLRLSAPELNAPDGIFWMPTGYYLVQVPLLLLRVDPLGAARWLSWLGVVAFAVVAARVGVRAGAHRVVVFTAALAWVCMPRVVAIANIARMEGVVLGMAAACLELLHRDRWPFAVAVALLAPLVHPVGVILAVAVAASLIVRRPARRPTTAEWVVLGLVAVAWVVEIAYFLAHADAAADHLRFQLTRKSGRAIVLQWWQWMLLVAGAVSGAVATLRWRRASPALAAVWTALALAGGFVLVDVVGREMWYEPLGRETALLLGLIAAAAALSRTPPAEQLRHTAAVVTALALAVVAVFAVRGSLVDGWYGMKPAASSRADWTSFSADALAQLQRLDAAGDQPQVVVIDPLSGFGQEVFSRSWSRLRFVQPTPATPMDTRSADYVLATPGAPFVTRGLVEQWGRQPPALEVRSASGTFVLQLFENPA